ncbi:MAG: pseudouridine synthase, partial [Dehalococcoidia bacterium]|nr:pseudouridine synthase [Dehalococcoidia bacterium]
MNELPLVRVLTDSGYGSRRETAALVKSGVVEVNGTVATSFTQKIDPETDSITVMGIAIANQQTQRVYLMMNKPADYLCTTSDDRGRPTVFDLLPEEHKSAGLHPAGRLDEDSTGLLILTNDGKLTFELTHPRFEHDKEYYVATTGSLPDEDIKRLEDGVEIEEQRTWPAKVELLEGQSPYAYSITIHEGRKRQVRLMFAAIGQQVAMLKRVRTGSLLLGELPEGAVRELTPAEVKELLQNQSGPPKAAKRKTARTTTTKRTTRSSVSPATAVESDTPMETDTPKEPVASWRKDRLRQLLTEADAKEQQKTAPRALRPTAQPSRRFEKARRDDRFSADRSRRPSEDSRPQRRTEQPSHGTRWDGTPAPMGSRRPFDSSRPQRRPESRFEGALLDDRTAEGRPYKQFDDERTPRRPEPRFEGARPDDRLSDERPRRQFDDSRPQRRPEPRFEGARRDDRFSDERPRRQFDDSRPQRRPEPRFGGARRDDRFSDERPRRQFDDPRPQRRPEPRFEGARRDDRPTGDSPRRQFNDSRPQRRPEPRF